MALAAQIWEQVAELGKRAALSPALFRAIDAAVPVAWEDDTLVIGLSAENGQHAGVLNAGDFKLKIEAAVRQVAKSPKASLRVIEGVHAEDWIAAKSRDAALTERRDRAVQKAASMGSTDTWDGLYEAIQNLWQEAEFRNFATGRARFLQKAMGLIESSAANLAIPGDEASEREFSRTIERIAGMVGSDPAVIAFLLLERQGPGGVPPGA